MDPAHWIATSLSMAHPVAQAATLGLATFVQEDVPTVGGALLSAAGRLDWRVAFAGCFLGI